MGIQSFAKSPAPEEGQIKQSIVLCANHYKTPKINTNTNASVYVPAHISFKPWMSYSAVTDTSSKQYDLISKATHRNDGLLELNGCVLVALGRKYGRIGTKYKITMSNGQVFRIIKADEKQDRHTKNEEGWQGTNGHLIECIIDTSKASNQILVTGSCESIIPGTVVKMEKI